MKKLIVGNWKMNQTLPLAKAFFSELKTVELEHEAWIAPQALHVSTCLHMSPDFIKIGAQNISNEDHGAFTGENSSFSLKELGGKFVIVGHSERRHLYAETSSLCAKKIRKALSHGLNVIYCVGETLDEREQNKTSQVIETQLKEGLHDLGPYASELLIIAYEPVWAIGTGKVATPDQAQEVHAGIRKIVGDETRILYGGSVKPENVVELLNEKDIDGALVGGASLKAADFIALCQAQL